MQPITLSFLPEPQSGKSPNPKKANRRLKIHKLLTNMLRYNINNHNTIRPRRGVNSWTDQKIDHTPVFNFGENEAR